MTPQTPDIFDTDLQQLFAGIVPDRGFEDRLVAALRPPRRLIMPPAITHAARAAVAVFAVGLTGYVGSHWITGQWTMHPHFSNSVASNSPDPDQVNLANQAARSAKNEIESDYISTLASRDARDDLGIVNKSVPPPLADLVQQSRQYIDEGKYAEASAVINNIKQQDPSNAYANSVDRFVKDKATIQEGRKWREKFDDQWTKQLNDANQKKIPYDDTIAYPPDWPKPANRGQSPPSGSVHGIDGTININTAPPQVLASLPEEQNHKEAPPAATPPVNAPKLPMDFYYTASDSRNKGANGSVSLQGENAYTGKTSVTGGTVALGVDKDRGISTSVVDAKKPQAGHSDNTTFRDANGNVVSNFAQGQRTLDWVSNVGNAAVPGSIPANPADDPAPLVVAPVADNRGGQAPSSTQPATIDDRKIIRSGTMEFDVDRFDTAQMQISKIVGELGGFVGATDSTKLPNGKVRGSIAVRIPPGHLDMLVLSLRALGDLKSQQITAADITKEYTDIESELAADRAMQDRLLDLIHNGKGTVKDLLAAENELGNWRTKIEKAEGMIRYYNAQVAMSTLTITLSEKDIQNPAAAVETETADMGIESADVETDRVTAMKLIDNVKGRIISAELKRFDAGQLAAKLVADVPPESAGAVIDQLKLIGKVARLEIQRQQNTTGGVDDGSVAVTSVVPLRTERKPTRLLISIYNLANVAPRKTTNVNLAATDVEAAYTALATAAKSNGGRVVTSNLDRSDPVRTTGSLVLEFPPGQFESAMTTLRDQGQVLKLTAVENPDTQNSTEAKQGLTVQLVSLASVPARETIQQTLAAVDVAKAYQAVLDAVNSSELTVRQGAVSIKSIVPHSHGRVQSAQLNEQDRQNVTADLQLEIPRATEDDFDKALAAAGVSISRTSTQAMNTDNAVDSKVQVHLTISSADHLPARETTKLQVEVPDVDKAAGAAQALAIADGGRVLDSTISRDKGKGIARLVLDLPLEKAGEALQQLREAGTVRGIDSTRDPQAPTGQFAHAIIGVEFATGDAIVADQTGPWAAIRQGLSTSINGLLWSLQWIVVGLFLLGPWLLLSWGGLKLLRRRSLKATAGTP